jgi:hypothetical protein
MTVYYIATATIVFAIGVAIVIMAQTIVGLRRENASLRERLENRNDWVSGKQRKKNPSESPVVEGQVIGSGS